jgi:hypothetical protein
MGATVSAASLAGQLGPCDRRPMSQICTTGTWTPKAGQEDAFVATWQEFAGWASQMPGATTLRLARDTNDPE